jgi:hypothetical protein
MRACFWCVLTGQVLHNEIGRMRATLHKTSRTIFNWRSAHLVPPCSGRQIWLLWQLASDIISTWVCTRTHDFWILPLCFHTHQHHWSQVRGQTPVAMAQPTEKTDSSSASYIACNDRHDRGT